MRPPENTDIRVDVTERPVQITTLPYLGDRIIGVTCWHHGVVANIFERTDLGYRYARQVARDHVGLYHVDMLRAGHTGVWDQIEEADLT